MMHGQKNVKFTMWALSCATFSQEARKRSAAQGPHSEVVPRAF